MVERLLFDGVDTEARALAVRVKDDLPVDRLPDEAKGALTFPELAFPGAEIAAQAPVSFSRPESCRVLHLSMMPD